MIANFPNQTRSQVLSASYRYLWCFIRSRKICLLVNNLRKASTSKSIYAGKVISYRGFPTEGHGQSNCNLSACIKTLHTKVFLTLSGGFTNCFDRCERAMSICFITIKVNRNEIKFHLHILLMVECPSSILFSPWLLLDIYCNMHE